ncbi:MAG TPA: DNA/RNA non-specific endonuclease [Myxococcales bacterium]|nr:DNA/RNA non-specific endonuclease [Myxococcales bacterium]
MQPGDEKDEVTATQSADLTAALSNGVPLSGLSGAKGSSSTFTLVVPSGATNLKFTLGTGTSTTNDADLYVRFGAAPTTTVFDCRSINTGNTESCAIATAQAGTYTALVFGFTAYSAVTITASFTAPAGGTTVLSNGVPLTGLSGAKGSTALFSLAVPAGATNLGFTLGTGTSSTNDADLYVRFGAAPTTATFDCRSINVGLNESCAIVNAQAGTYFVLLTGFAAYSGAVLTGTYTAPGAGGGGGAGTGGAAISVHTKLGIPDASTAVSTNTTHYLSVKHQYVVSYNGTRKTPNWSSWELNTSWLGTAARQDTYRADTTLPANIPQASLADYSGSGFDRGHMCPSADRTLSVADNTNTFFLTNMVPQSSNNNQGAWADLEDYTRGLAMQGKEVMVISGPIYSGTITTVGNGLQVPTSTWKVITVLDSPTQGAANVTTSTRVIAVIMPNRDAQIAITADWHTFRTTVRAIEAATGLNIMSDVPQAVQDVIETHVDTLP